MLYAVRDDTPDGHVWLFNTKPVKDKQTGLWFIGEAQTANCRRLWRGFPSLRRGECKRVKLVEVEG